MREYRFVADCRLETSLHVGSGEESNIADAGFRRRADGTLVIPGTSIGGALRSLAERLSGERSRCLFATEGGAVRGDEKVACQCRVCKLFGNVRPAAPDALASRVVVLDAILDTPRVRVVDGVALDRSRRTAADGRKFDWEEVGAGARVRIEVRGSDLTDDELALIGAALRLMGEGRMPLGGRTARGLGILREESLKASWRDMGKSNHLLAALMYNAEDDAVWPGSLEPFPGASKTLPDEEVFTVSLRSVPEGTFLIADPKQGVETGFDRSPRGGGSSPELSAASLRGALRSGAERILRTLRTNGAACDPFDTDRSCAVVERLARKRPQASAPRCLACQLFGNEEHASWLRVIVRPGIASAGTPYVVPFDHVAIDRFTGGAREGFKFDTEASRGAAFEVDLTLVGVPEPDRAWVLGLLALTLQDLAEGRIQVGHGAARGHGQFRIESPPLIDDLAGSVRALWRKLDIELPTQRANP